MPGGNGLGRRQFLRQLLAGAALAAGLPLLSSCGGAGAAAPASGSPSAVASRSAAQSGPAAAASASAAAASASAGQPAAQKVLFGTSRTGAELPFALAQERGYFAEAGVEVEEVVGLVGSRQVPAIGSGQLDLSGGSLSVSILNAINRGVPLKLVGSMGFYKDRNTSSTWLVRRSDLKDKFTRLQDVRNAKIGLIAPDSIPEYCVATWFQRAGLDWKQAVEVQVLDFPSMVTALANKELDLAILGEPFVTQAEAKGIADRWLSAPEMVGRPIQWVVLIAGPGLYKKKDAAVRWFKAFIRGLRDYETAFVTRTNAALHKQAIDALDRMTRNADPTLYERTTFWLPGPNAPADAMLDEASLRDQLGYWKRRGVATPEYEQLVDPTFAQEASKQLG